MKSPEFRQDSPETRPVLGKEVEEKIDSPDKVSELPEDKKYLETKREKEQTDKKIEEVLSWIKEAEPRQSEYLRVVQELKKAREERKKGTLSMLRELWRVTPSDCKAALIGEFIFNPNALKARYFTEMSFQRNMRSRWKSPKN